MRGEGRQRLRVHHLPLPHAVEGQHERAGEGGEQRVVVRRLHHGGRARAARGGEVGERAGGGAGVGVVYREYREFAGGEEGGEAEVVGVGGGRGLVEGEGGDLGGEACVGGGAEEGVGCAGGAAEVDLGAQRGRGGGGY